VSSTSPADDRKATYLIGRMELAGLLIDLGLDPDSDEARQQSNLRHDAAVKFATMHFRLWVPSTPPLHLRGVLDDNGIAAIGDKYGRWLSAAMTTPPAGRMLAHQVLERAALQEIAPATEDEETLRRVLDVLSGRRAATIGSLMAPVLGRFAVAVANLRGGAMAAGR
jgi:hypothetical protein